MAESLGFAQSAKERMRFDERNRRMLELGLAGLSGISLMENLDTLQGVGAYLSASTHLGEAFTQYEAALSVKILQMVEDWKADIKRRNGVQG